MLVYQAPLRDIRFVLLALLGSEDLTRLPAFSSLTPDTLELVLDSAAARFCERELLPLARSGDEEGCRFEDGTVRTPRGFAEAYRLFRDQGWASLACDPAVGGQGLPELLNLAVSEMVCSTNLVFGTYTGLAHAAYLLLAAHGTGDVRERYLKPLAEGRWGGTMCLTEPQCGTDSSASRPAPRAEPAEDGSYRVTGDQRFRHGRRARPHRQHPPPRPRAASPARPRARAALSLFLVPSFSSAPTAGSAIATGSGAAGSRRRWAPRLGRLHAQLRGGHGLPPRRARAGPARMFTMMNTARLASASKAWGSRRRPTRTPWPPARERRQRRVSSAAPAGRKGGTCPSSSIPMCGGCCCACGPSPRVPAPWSTGSAARSTWRGITPTRSAQAADDLVQLLSRVVKAFLTDEGFAAANLGLQVFVGTANPRTRHGRLVHEARIGRLTRRRRRPGARPGRASSARAMAACCGDFSTR